MTPSRKHIMLLATLLTVTHTAQAVSEPLPWQQHSASPQPPQQYQASISDEDQRQQDDRRLNALATRFYHTTRKDPKIIPKLKAVLKDVKKFHAELLDRTYNAVDIIKDTENLEGRVSSQLGKLEAEAKAPK